MVAVAWALTSPVDTGVTMRTPCALEDTLAARIRDGLASTCKTDARADVDGLLSAAEVGGPSTAHRKAQVSDGTHICCLSEPIV